MRPHPIGPVRGNWPLVPVLRLGPDSRRAERMLCGATAGRVHRGGWPSQASWWPLPMEGSVDCFRS